MEEANNAHFKKFGIYPVYIGANWEYDPIVQMDMVYDAIDADIPYNEYEALPPMEQIAYDNGDLLF